METRDICEYYNNYVMDYGFECIQARFRQRLVLSRLLSHNPASVLEIGCGSELVSQAYLQRSTVIKGDMTWVIVEPCNEFASAAHAQALPNVFVINDFFEDVVSRIADLMPKAPDMILCSGLLHEVPSAIHLLSEICTVMRADTILHVNVPNSESFHRRLALSMGLIQETKALSSRNRQLAQCRVYDLDTLKRELESCGLRVTEEGGYFLKPFHHEQMEQLQSSLGEAILDGLFEMGITLPDLASEIWVEALLNE